MKINRWNNILYTDINDFFLLLFQAELIIYDLKILKYFFWKTYIYFLYLWYKNVVCGKISISISQKLKQIYQQHE